MWGAQFLLNIKGRKVCHKIQTRKKSPQEFQGHHLLVNPSILRMNVSLGIPIASQKGDKKSRTSPQMLQIDVCRRICVGYCKLLLSQQSTC